MADRQVDILVLGGNPGGCAAAVTAARAGFSVLLLEPSRTLGGNNANGVFAFDTTDPRTLGGIAIEVRDRIRAHYRAIGLDDPLFGKRADQVWESHVAAKAWADLARDTPNLTVMTGAVAVDARVEAGRIAAVDWLPAVNPSGDPDPDASRVGRVRPRLVVDASYEGDILAWAGVPHRIGREARSAREPHAGRIYTSDVQRGRDGFLPHSVLPGSTGEADDGVMAFACRLHCRWYEDDRPTAPHRIQEPPPGYDPSRYAWAPQGRTPDGEPVWFTSIYVLVNGKFLVNRTVRGNELAGPARDYILAHPRDRGAVRRRFEAHALGFLYFIQTAGGCPRLGLADDEFGDNGHLPYRIYVREGRRIVGRAEMSETEISPYVAGDGFRPPLQAESVAIGDWPLESRACSDVLEPGYKYPEGWLFNRVAQAPYQVPYGCLLPDAVENLLVCGSVSATHVGTGAVRVESVRIALGTAAGLAAALALGRGCRPADVPVPELQDGLIARGVMLTFFGDVPAAHPCFAPIQRAALRGVVPRNDDRSFRPDHPATWSDLVEMTVRRLAVPIGVTGIHFEKVGPRDPGFRYFEAVYELGSRVGVDVFDVAKLWDEDPIGDLVRPTAGTRLIPIEPEAGLTWAQADLTLGRIASALGLAHRPPADRPDGVLMTRGALCAALDGIARGGN